MITKTPARQPHQVRVTFELPASLVAKQIFLVGDFNHWCPTATPLHRELDGVWRVTLALPVGSRHEYRYRIDDTWKTDYHADGLTPNPYGTANSVVCASLPDLGYVAWSSSQVRERRCPRPAHTPSLAAPSQCAQPLGQRGQRTLAS